jgi:hypothetical protein
MKNYYPLHTLSPQINLVGFCCDGPCSFAANFYIAELLTAGHQLVKTSNKAFQFFSLIVFTKNFLSYSFHYPNVTGVEYTESTLSPKNISWMFLSPVTWENTPVYLQQFVGFFFWRIRHKLTPTTESELPAYGLLCLMLHCWKVWHKCSIILYLNCLYENQHNSFTKK